MIHLTTSSGKIATVKEWHGEVIFYYNRRVGTIKRTNKGLIYVTRRRWNDHFFRKYGGFGISVEILRFLKRKGVRTIVIIYVLKDCERLLKSDIDAWFDLGELYRCILENGEFDWQLVLHIKHMTEIT